jgi:hypothetical protein
VAPVPDPIAVEILPCHGSAMGVRFGPSPRLTSCGVEGVGAVIRAHAGLMSWIRLPQVSSRIAVTMSPIAVGG